MKTLLIALVLLCASTASAQWGGYVPIEQSRSYNAYRGPLYAYPYYGRVRGYGGIDPYGPPMPRMHMHYIESSRGTVYQGFSW
jgi:hypothetical protein